MRWSLILQSHVSSLLLYEKNWKHSLSFRDDLRRSETQVVVSLPWNSVSSFAIQSVQCTYVTRLASLRTSRGAARKRPYVQGHRKHPYAVKKCGVLEAIRAIKGSPAYPAMLPKERIFFPHVFSVQKWGINFWSRYSNTWPLWQCNPEVMRIAPPK
jgi:hypothetical protein